MHNICIDTDHARPSLVEAAAPGATGSFERRRVYSAATMAGAKKASQPSHAQLHASVTTMTYRRSRIRIRIMLKYVITGHYVCFSLSVPVDVRIVVSIVYCSTTTAFCASLYCSLR